MRASPRAALFVPLFIAVVASAWVTLLAWERGPYARYLHAVDWADLGPLGALCRELPVVAPLVGPLLYAAAWLLMIAAMMLPTTLPLLDAFRRLTAGHAQRHRLLSALVAGYLGAWLLFGLVVDVVDTGLHALVAANGWLLRNGWAVGVGVLALAGAYQFSRLKYACLDRCRSPLSFIMEHWRGANPGRDAFALGAHHGLFCIGCCWSLMVVMFVVGGGSIGWMLGLAALMAVEKNVSWGRRLAAPTGAALLLCAAAIALRRLAGQ